jgi:putative drug exporter of the RND superfamily
VNLTWPRRLRHNVAERASVGRMFERLAHFVVRRPWLVIGAWLLLVAMLSVTVPPLMRLASDRNQELLPADSAVMVATRQMTEAFGEPGIQNIALVVLTNEHGLTSADEDIYRSLVDKLHRDQGDVVMVQDFISQPPLRDVMESKDRQAWFIPVGVTGELGSDESNAAYQRVVATVKQTVAGSNLTMHMTGLTATVAEREDLGLRDLRVVETATLVMVLLILIVVYRSFVTILLPLVTIGVTQLAATQVVAALAQWGGLPISQQTLVFMSAMMIGAGVDYAVFLISRYHEYIRDGVDSDRAVARALTAIGKVIAASAATVAVTFLGMSFTTLKVFSTTGPALAVSVAVAFLAAITLLPAMLVLGGRRGWVKPRRELTQRFWRRSGIHIVRRPVAHLAASLAVLIPLAACVAALHTSYDARTTLPPSAESNIGMASIERHFPASTTAPQYVFIQSPHDLRTTKALADLEQMAQRVSQLPDIAAVRGVTRPTGAPLEQATLSFQAGEIANKLAEANSKITGSIDERQALVGGAGKLADSLATVRNQLTKTTGILDGLSKTMASMKDQLESSQEFQDAQRQLADAQAAGEPSQPTRSGSENFQDMVGMATDSLDSLNNDPGCDTDPNCGQQRDRLQHLVDGLHKMQPSLDAAAKAIRTLGLSNPNGLKQSMASLEQGANALADGSRKIAEGLRILDDQTKQLGEGLSRASAFLLSMKLNASDPGAAGFYISPEILGNDQFKDLARVFMSPDGHSARYLVQSTLDPYDTKAMDQVKTILATARGAQANTSLADASISMSGMTPYYSELRDYYNHDLRFIVLMTVAVVFLILILLLRAVVAPLYLVGTVILSCLSAVGIGVIVLQLIGGQAMTASTPAMAFIVLVAVGADYNMLLISRIRDESPHGIPSGVIRTVRSTGSVITSAGMIFAAPMLAMLFSSIGSMVQGGFIIGVGLLLDTFLVRTVTVPALAVLVGKANWWPSGWRRKPGPSDDAESAPLATQGA